MSAERLEKLERLFQALDGDVNALKAGARPARDGDHVNPDNPWNCGKCGGCLAMYDPAKDVLRIRHRDLYVFIQVGPGGFIDVICRTCGELNSQAYVDAPAGEQPAAAG